MRNKAGLPNSNFIKRLIHINLLLLSTCGFSSHALANEPSPCPPCDYLVTPNFALCPYVGVNGELRHMSWPNGFGGNLFKRDYPEADFYLGAKFNDCWGVQFGYKTTTTRTSFPSVGGNSTRLGNETTLTEGHLTQAQFKGFHGELVGYLPIYNPDCVYLFGTIGATNFHLSQRDYITQFGPQPVGISVAASTFKKNRTILSLGGGLEIKVDHRLSIRVNIGWDNTARFKNINAQQTNIASVLQVKNSYTYGAGIILRLF